MVPLHKKKKEKKKKKKKKKERHKKKRKIGENVVEYYVCSWNNTVSELF